MHFAMRRFARHLVTLCSAASLVLCVAAVALWVRSHWEGYALHHVTQTPRAKVETWAYTARGALWVGRIEDNFRRPGWHFDRVPTPPAVSYTNEFPPGLKLGFGYMPRTAPRRMYGIAVPLWFVSLAAAAAPAWWT